MAKHENPFFKLGILLILFATGGLIGGAATGVFTPSPVAASVACEQDECDDGWFGGDCEQNDGHDTGCDHTDTSFWFDGCETYVCEN